MNRTEFITATAIILFATFVLGWIASWIFHRLTRVTRADMSQLDNLARELHDAEEARDQAVADLEAAESRIKVRLTEVEGELQASTEALGESRAEVEELRAYIERRLARQQPPGARP
ncbi:hypothetical protein [Paracoccus pacificus]|uniref:Uncharacterized protein n=1 Tax=Paracoccus pacificus TaxID=1463598 RepID=A0ABW4R8P5_9RHOB